MSTIVVELYQALREAGVAEQLARDAAHAVIGSDMKNELVTKSDLKAELAAFRAEMRGEFADFRTEMRAEFADLRTEMRTSVADLRAEIANSRVEMIKWAVGAMIAMTGVFAAISRLG